MKESSSDQRVIIVAPVGQDAAIMAEVLNSSGINSRICQSLNVAANEVTSRTSAMLLTEEALSLPHFTGLIQALRVQPAWSEMPIIVLVGGHNNRHAVLQHQLASLPGTATILERPMQSATLLNTVQVALRSRYRQLQVRDLLSEQERNVLHLEKAIAQRKEAEKAMAHLAAIVTYSDDAIISKDLNGIITSWNRGAEHLFGYTAEEAIGQPVTMLIPKDRLGEESRILERLRRGESILHYETERRRKDGTMVVISLTISPIQDVHGHIIGASKVARDISEQKRGEQLLREHAHSLETLNRVGALLAGELDIHKLIQAVTDASTELTGAKFGAFFFNTVNDEGGSYVLYTLSGVPRESFEKFGLPRNTPVFEPTFSGKGIVRSDDITQDAHYGRLEPHHGMPAGHLPVRSYLAVPVVSRFGKVLGGLFFGHPDPGVFTEQAQHLVSGIAAQAAIAIDNALLLESERAARSEAERATRLKDEFLATLSHELRTPLNAILLRTDLLMRGGTMDVVTWKKDVEAIQKGAKAQARLIEDLLDVSAIMSGKIRLETRLINLPEIIDGAIEVIAPTAAAKNIHVDHVRNDVAGSIKGDATRIQQIIWNLLSNAVKYTPRGGRVEIRVEREAQDVAIRVVDNGKGIAADFLPYVFDRFSQADSSSTRRYGGLGLGLAIVKYMAELHGGSVSVESAGEGQGSTFTVRLPAPEAVVKTGRSTDQSSLAGVHVFIVDDDPAACELLRRILEQRDARVSAASSTAEAMEKIPQLAPDILLCDIGMPEKSGYDLIREIRSGSAPDLARLPAVAVTAFARPEDRVVAAQAGFDMHVAKPVNVNELMTVIRTLTR